MRAWIKDFSKTSEDISNISEAWSEWSVNECEIGIIILAIFVEIYGKAKDFPGAYLTLGSEYCMSLPFLAQNIKVLEEPRTENQISIGGGKETLRMNCSVNFN